MLFHSNYRRSIKFIFVLLIGLRQFVIFLKAASVTRSKFGEFTTLPRIGKYKSGDTIVPAVFLAKSNLNTISLEDIEEENEKGIFDVFERRIAKDVIPVPIVRPDIEVALLNSLSLVRSPASQTSTTISNSKGALTQRDGGIWDNLRFLLSEGIELGDYERRRMIIGSQGASIADQSTMIMKKLSKELDNGKYENPYLGFITVAEKLLGLYLKGFLLEVADRPNADTIYMGGAVLVGKIPTTSNSNKEIEEREEEEEEELPPWCAETAMDVIRQTQRNLRGTGTGTGTGTDDDTIFLKCHSDEVIGLHLALRFMEKSRTSTVGEEILQKTDSQSQYHRLFQVFRQILFIYLFYFILFF